MTRGVQPSVWVLRGAAVVGIVGGLLAGVGSGFTPPAWVVVLVALGALLSAFRPEHLSVTITVGFVVVWWATRLHARMPAVVLVVAALLTVAHVAATLLAYGPPSLPLDPRLGLLWLRRGALTWLGALLVWVVARSYTDQATPALFWLSGLAAAVVAAVTAGSLVSWRGAGSGR